MKKGIDNIVPDSGIDIEKTAKLLVEKFNRNLEKIQDFLVEKSLIIRPSPPHRLNNIEIILQNPAVRANFMAELYDIIDKKAIR